MKRLVKWLVINGIFAAALWLAFHEGITGAKNVVIFYSWFVFLMACLSLHEDVVKSSAEKLNNPVVPLWIDAAFDITVLLVLVWHGWWFTGVAYLLHMLLIASARDKAKKLVAAEVKP